MGGCQMCIEADGQFARAGIPLGFHHAVDALGFRYQLAVRVVTTEFDGAGPHVWTIVILLVCIDVWSILAVVHDLDLASHTLVH